MMWWKGWLTTQCRYVAFVFVLALTLTSCGGDDDGDNPSGSLTGNYTGTIQDSLAGAGTLQATLSQAGSSLTGTFQTTFANPNNNGSGTISGTVNGTSVTLIITPSVPTACPFNATLTQVSSTQITGTYTALNCTVAESGTVNITRQ
jgi:hypothetical protein